MSDFIHYFQLYEDPRTENLRKLSYGIILPIICALGILGNVLNLVVLTRRNMRGTAYIYMRGNFKDSKSQLQNMRTY
jgi:neurotensin receptor 1